MSRPNFNSLPFPVAKPDGNVLAQIGTFHCRLLDPCGRVADEWDVANAAVYAGLNYMQGAAFKSTAQLATWYIGLIDNAGFSTVVPGDTMASHAGWAEFTAYSQATRPAWTPGTPASGVLASSAATVFTITSPGVLKGMFLASDSAKSGTAGTLWATALETSTRNVAAAQALQVFYSNTLTPVS